MSRPACMDTLDGLVEAAKATYSHAPYPGTLNALTAPWRKTTDWICGYEIRSRLSSDSRG